MSRIIVALMTLLFAVSTQAEDLSGRDIIDRARKNSSGFDDKSEREMLLKARTDDSGDSSSLSIFTAPQREKGIALLTHAKPGEGDEQWLYLPSTKRLKRITGSNRTSSFRGSEFTFEDLSDQNPDDYRFERVEDEACGQLQCYVVDRFPGKALESSYSKTRTWIDTTHYRPMKAEFYDASGKLLKNVLRGEGDVSLAETL